MKDSGSIARPRVTLMAALGLAMCFVVIPSGALASDSPEAAVLDLLAAVEEERFDDLDGMVCDEYRGAIRDRFDVAASLPVQIDPAVVAGAVDVVIDDRSVELINEADERAEVRVSGHIGAIIDAALVRELAEMSLELLGVDFEPGQVDELANQLIGQLQTGSPFADDVSVIRQGETWLVCDDILVGEDAVEPDDMAQGICVHMTVAELNLIDEERGGAGFDSYSRRTWDEASGLCTWDAGEGSIGSVAVGRFDFPFDDIAAARPGGAELMVAGHRAYLADNELFVELGDGLLYVRTLAKSMPDGDIDYLAMPAGVAELVLPRIDG